MRPSMLMDGQTTNSLQDSFSQFAGCGALDRPYRRNHVGLSVDLPADTVTAGNPRGYETGSFRPACPWVNFHGADVDFAEKQGARHIFSGLVFSDRNVFRPKDEPDPRHVNGYGPEWLQRLEQPPILDVPVGLHGEPTA